MYIQIYLFILLLYTQQTNTKECVLILDNGKNLTAENSKFGFGLPYILDTTIPGTLLLNGTTENVEKIDNVSNNMNSSEPYMNAVLTNAKIFQLNLTNNFINYEEYETKDQMRITVQFLCLSGSNWKLEIIQPITDTNNHDPQFVNAPYFYNLPMPFPKNFRIDLLNKIAARDIDLTNNKISFFLNGSDPISEGLTAQWLSTDIKINYAKLITTAVLNFKSDVTFELFANDSGIPTRTSKTTVTISIDKPNSILQFAEPIYVADYTKLKPETANGTIFSFTEGEISLGGGIDDTVNYLLNENSGEYQENFKLNISSDYSTVRLILFNPPEKFFNESFVLLTLTAKKTGVKETTVLHISLPGRSTSKTATTTTTTTTEFSTSTTIISTEDPRDTDNPDICTDCDVAIIVLSSLLTGITVGLVSFIVIAWRQSKTFPKASKNENTVQVEHVEMSEIYRGSNGTTPAGSLQRSVAFNDTVEEIDAVRL